MLDLITPLILTRNEEANIARTLAALSWATEVIIIDSFSTDKTVRIAGNFPNVKVLQREFDQHAAQWSFGLSQVGTPWTLALDADHLISSDLTRELAALELSVQVAGARAPFRYAIDGRPLRRSLYPPRVVLAYTTRSRFHQDGHTQRLLVDGSVIDLTSPIIHDDRKSFREFVSRQRRYMQCEADKLLHGDKLTHGRGGRIRRLIVVVPLLIGPYLLFGRGLILDGWPGVRYTFERMVAEGLLSIELLRRALSRR